VVKEFNLTEAIDEVVQMQTEKANMQGVRLWHYFKPQIIGEDMPVVSLFGDNYEANSENGEEEKNQEKLKYDLSFHKWPAGIQFKKEPVMVLSDKRRIQ
jgi:hypothetical protein